VSNPAISPKPAFEAPSDLMKLPSTSNASDRAKRLTVTSPIKTEDMADNAEMTVMRCRLDRPAVAAASTAGRIDGVWVVDLDLDDRQADGRACIRCGQRGSSMLPVGWAERPTDVLRRIGVSDDARNCQIFAHVECQEAP
jgi:hypothetical protein